MEHFCWVLLILWCRCTHFAILYDTSMQMAVRLALVIFNNFVSTVLFNLTWQSCTQWNYNTISMDFSTMMFFALEICNKSSKLQSTSPTVVILIRSTNGVMFVVYIYIYICFHYMLLMMLCSIGKGRWVQDKLKYHTLYKNSIH